MIIIRFQKNKTKYCLKYITDALRIDYFIKCIEIIKIYVAYVILSKLLCSCERFFEKLAASIIPTQIIF